MRYFLLLLPLIITSCLKSDVLDQPEDINFLRTEFYQQNFDDFSFEITGLNYSDPQVLSQDTTYVTAVTFRLPEEYMEELFDNWSHTVELESNQDVWKLRRDMYELTDTIGRRKVGATVNYKLILKVQKVFKVMATTDHAESFVVKG